MILETILRLGAPIISTAGSWFWAWTCHRRMVSTREENVRLHQIASNRTQEANELRWLLAEISKSKKESPKTNTRMIRRS